MELQSGEGWRLRVDPARQPFPVLIGGQHWAAELTWGEARQLQEGVCTLLQQWHAMTPQLMPEESLVIEHDVGGLWLELSGSARVFALRFVLQPPLRQGGRARGLEGGWDGAATAALVAVLEDLQWPAVDP